MKKSNQPPLSLPELEQGVTKEGFKEEVMPKLRLEGRTGVHQEKRWN